MNVIRLVEKKERIWLLDAIRGFAIFGILWVNISLRSDPIQLSSLAGSKDWLTWITALFANFKFRSLFSFLFGFGMSLQLRRAHSDSEFIPMYLRRLSALFLIGVAHAVFGWPGDILALYGVTALVLVGLRKATPRTLGILVVSLLVAAVFQDLFGPRVFNAVRLKADVASAYPIYQYGGFWQITMRRAYDYLSYWLPSLYLSFPRVLAMMLLGVLFERQSYISRWTEHLGFWKKVLLWGYLIGIPANALFAFWKIDLAPSRVFTIWAKVAHISGSAFLSMAYVATLVLLSNGKLIQAVLKTLAPVGRMALTSYLGHSVICAFLFYGYGMKMFGRVSNIEGIAIAMAICLSQVAVAYLWFRYFTMGPVEWIWRWATYGSRPALRQPASKEPPPLRVEERKAA